MPASDTSTKIIDERFMSSTLAAVPARLRQAVASVVDRWWDDEEHDYINNCPGAALRKGHTFEDLSMLRRWLEGNEDGLHVDPSVMITNPEPAPGGYHYLMEARRKTVREVHRELLALVGHRDAGTNILSVDGADEYFDVCMETRGEMAWPVGRIVVYAVTGGSEGYYVHVAVIANDRDGKHQTLILGKGWDKDAAWALARRLSEILGV